MKNLILIVSCIFVYLSQSLLAMKSVDPATHASLVTQNQCGKRILRSKGHTPKSFKEQSQVVFDDDNIFVSPEKPKIPGCFNLTAKRVKITGELRSLNMEFEMRIGHVPDPTQKPLPCQKSSGQCACGSVNSCMYCDFCRNFKRHFSSVTLTERRGQSSKDNGISNRDSDKCQCSFGQKGKTLEYDLTAEVCTPDSAELGSFLPEKVLAQVDSGSKTRGGKTKQQFTLFTTINIYNLRFQNLNKHIINSPKYLNKLKTQSLIGCHLIGTNVEVKGRGN